MAHHDCVLFRWELRDATSGELADGGVNLFLLSPGGRIADDYQFALGADSPPGLPGMPPVGPG